TMLPLLRGEGERAHLFGNSRISDFAPASGFSGPARMSILARRFRAAAENDAPSAPRRGLWGGERKRPGGRWSELSLRVQQEVFVFVGVSAAELRTLPFPSPLPSPPGRGRTCLPVRKLQNLGLRSRVRIFWPCAHEHPGAAILRCGGKRCSL